MPLAPATCAAEGCFCEAPRDSPVKQPANTWSNLGFLLIAVFILRHRGSGAAAFAGIVAAIGLGSMAFHSTLTFAGEWVDNAAMYLFTSHLTFLSLSRTGAGIPSPWPATITMTSLLAAGAYLRPEWRRLIFASSVCLAGLSEFRAQRLQPLRNKKWFWVGVGCFALAYLFWWLDLYGVLCSPRSLFQGHALWHLLSAAATGALYLHHQPRDER